MLRSYLQIALRVQKQILGLQIAVDDVEHVEILEGKHDLSSVEASVRFTKTELWPTNSFECSAVSLRYAA